LSSKTAYYMLEIYWYNSILGILKGSYYTIFFLLNQMLFHYYPVSHKEQIKCIIQFIFIFKLATRRQDWIHRFDIYCVELFRFNSFRWYFKSYSSILCKMVNFFNNLKFTWRLLTVLSYVGTLLSFIVFMVTLQIDIWFPLVTIYFLG